MPGRIVHIVYPPKPEPSGPLDVLRDAPWLRDSMPWNECRVGIVGYVHADEFFASLPSEPGWAGVVIRRDAQNKSGVTWHWPRECDRAWPEW